MYTETIEIYSDTTNAAILRHPGRRFPGVLVQGDTLYSMCQAADYVCKSAIGKLPDDEYAELNGLRNHLWELLIHYKNVLAEHEIPLPFSEQPRA
ncbi:MAG: hypothetical protein WC236_10805 [Gallionellaceae bacterium]|jgi:hypothetical protein